MAYKYHTVSFGSRFSFFFILLAAALALTSARGAGGSPSVELGIDVVERDHFALFQGKKIGLVTNQTGVDGAGRRTREVLHRAPGVHLVRLFSPEHGIDGTILAGKYVKSQRDEVTGLPVYSLYEETRKPTPEMLRGLDMLVFDMQDIGVRSYTYISTMVKCMEAAGECHVPFVVLDRPNPLSGIRVEGPPVEKRWISFVGQVPVPYVHGLTVGELARMTNDLGWNGAKCRLTIVPMRGWKRAMTWSDTGLGWVQTSPNIPYAVSPVYYAVTGVVGSLAGLNIGIGTNAPFQCVASANLPAEKMAARIEALGVTGLHAKPFYDRSAGWKGVDLRIDPHPRTNLCSLALYFLAQADRSAHLFNRTPPGQLNLFYKVYGSASIRGRLEDGDSVGNIVASWEPSVERFKDLREPYLLYPNPIDTAAQ